jgi:hypothetical protein
MITARQAQLKFNDKDYVDAMIVVNQAIIDASPNSHEVGVSILTGTNNTPLQVKYALEKVGFNVILNHYDNGFSNINVRW